MSGQRVPTLFSNVCMTLQSSWYARLVREASASQKMKNITYLRWSHSAAFSYAVVGMAHSPPIWQSAMLYKILLYDGSPEKKMSWDDFEFRPTSLKHVTCIIRNFHVGRPSPFRTTPVSSKHGWDLELPGWIAVWDCHVRFLRVCGLWSHICLCFHSILGDHSPWIGAIWQGGMERRRICWTTCCRYLPLPYHDKVDMPSVFVPLSIKLDSGISQGWAPWQVGEK